MPLKTHRILYCLGLSLYLASFFLVAFTNFQGPVPGWAGAEMSVLISIIQVKDVLRGAPPVAHTPLEFFSVFVTALINPAFLLCAVAAPFTPTKNVAKVVKVSRVLTLLMIPFCWVVFHYELYSPREGHFVWIVGMLLVLFSGE